MSVSKRSHRLALVAIAFSIFIETVDISIVAVALPSIAQDFQVDFTSVQWVALISAMTQASLSLMIGSLGGIFGNKRMLMWGLYLTGLGNVMCAVSPSLSWLIAARVVQAVGLTMAGALILAIIAETFPENERGKAFGFIGTMVSIGIVVGPVAGGLILDSFSWRLVFVFDLIFVAITLPLAHWYLRNTPGTGWRKFDFVGVFLFFASLLTFLLGSTFQQTEHLRWTSGFLYGGSAAALIGFVFHEFRVENPILNLALFRVRQFSTYISARYLAFFVYGGVWLILPFYLETMLGLEPAVVGVLLAIQPAVFGLGSWTSGQLVGRIGRRPLILFSLVTMAVAFGWMSLLDDSLTLWSFTLQMALLGLGTGTLQPPANSVIFSEIPSTQMGMVSSLTTVVRIHSRTLGIAVLGGLWVYQTNVRRSADMEVAGLNGYLPQIESFTFVCLVAALIMAAMAMVCIWESVRNRYAAA